MLQHLVHNLDFFGRNLLSLSPAFGILLQPYIKVTAIVFPVCPRILIFETLNYILRLKETASEVFFVCQSGLYVILIETP